MAMRTNLAVVPREEEDPGVSMLIPADQIIFDPNQPRKKWTQKGIERLARSIEDQGLQQPVIVTYSHTKGNKKYYYIKAGERRYRAHLLLGRKNVQCVVKKETYKGEVDVSRILAQATENSLREPHIHEEMINVVRLVVEEEYKQSDGAIGYIGKAISRVSIAFGKSEAWVQNYHILANLHPDLTRLLDIIDEDDEGQERLNFNVALSLARAPKETQLGILQKSDQHFKKSFHNGLAFVTSQARSVREKRGEKIRGKRPHEAIDILTKFVNALNNKHDQIFGYMKSAEIKTMLSSASVSDVDSLLNAINMASTNIKALQSLIQERRDKNYAHLSVARKK